MLSVIDQVYIYRAQVHLPTRKAVPSLERYAFLILTSFEITEKCL